ncbi:MAG TPA: hypothetical protein EYH11_00400 [Sulfurimonas autotrophica]|nr:hypothetical protein [Sulfurimonas autotrophica]
MARNFCLLIIFTCSLFANENFWFSYKVAIDNKVIVYEERNISPLMQSADMKEYKYLCQLNIKKKQYQSTEHFLNENFERVLECFYHMNTKVVNHTLVETKGVIERTVLTIIPTKFTVDFKDDFANIKTIK